MNLSEVEPYWNVAARDHRKRSDLVCAASCSRASSESAEAWDAMASQGEMMERLAQTSAENRIKQPYQRRSPPELT